MTTNPKLSALERVQRMTAKPGGKPGGRPPQPGDRFYREYLMANFGDGGTDSSNTGTESQRP